MAYTKYSFSISTDFPNHKVASDRLDGEIRNSSIVTALDRIDTAGDICDVWFKALLSAPDMATLGDLVAAHSGEPIVIPPPVQITNPFLTVNAMPPAGRKSNQISQNWCDRTTWWYSAARVISEVASSTDPDRKVWNLAHQNIIDVFHGKLTGEEVLQQYRVVVLVNGVVKNEVNPHTSEGDFVVDYAAGTLTFSSAVQAGHEPVVSYYYENGSTWAIVPSSGEVWKLKGAESQFSEDVEMLDTMIYEVWAYDPNNLPNKMMVAEPDYYKSIYDFINDSNKAYPEIPAIGGAGWRGTQKKISVFAWDFQTTTELISSYGMELRVRLEHDQPYGGTFATGTFYFIREQEG